MNICELEKQLNDPSLAARQEALTALVNAEKAGEIPAAPIGADVNNHIHTWYSFSPYSPTAAVWFAHRAGLSTAGIMDHDSVAGIREFHEAGRIVGMATTGGMECRVYVGDTAIRGRRVNNPDQNDIAYIAFHGLPVASLDAVEAFIAPRREMRCERNRKMCARISEKYAPYGISLDFDRDVYPVSKANEGGSVTERHILWALSLKLIEKFGRGEALIRFLREELGLSVSAKNEGWLLDVESDKYVYDLLGVLKSDTSFFYLPADAECAPIAEAVAVCEAAGGICAYAYLGDVGDSVTGDKRAQKFEDEYLDTLFDVLKATGFRAVTYMPSRNTPAQLERIREKCRAEGFFQISGEDINSPRQSFVCVAARAPEFDNLKESTWALIGHEMRTLKDPKDGFFGAQALSVYPDLEARTAAFAALAR